MSILELCALVSLVAAGAFCWAVLKAQRTTPLSAPTEDMPAPQQSTDEPFRLRAVS